MRRRRRRRRRRIRRKKEEEEAVTSSRAIKHINMALQSGLYSQHKEEFRAKPILEFREQNYI
jgi:hypothetical protein